MNIPCPNAVRCPGSDFPITNFSSEDPDHELFVGVSYGWDYNIPPLGRIWATPGCVSWCITTTSQQDADTCAARQQILCDTGNGTDTDNPDGSDDPNIPSIPPYGPQLYPNEYVQCASPCPDGSQFYGHVLAGEVLARSQALADRIATSLACRRARLERICIAAFDGFSCADQFNVLPELTQQLHASSTYPITGWSVVAGALPPGWILETSGLLHGKPDTAGDFTFTVQAATAVATATKSMDMHVLGFVTDFDLPDATVGAAYSKQLVADGGAMPDTFALTSGSLPAGLAMDEFGLISGTPTTAATNVTFTISVSDNFGHTCSQQFIMDVVVAACPDWATTLWPVPIISVGGFGAAVFVPNSAPGATFTGSVIAPDTTTDSASLTVQYGTITGYNGPACNCNLHIVISFKAGSPVAGVNITYGPMSIPALSLPNLGLLADGSYDYPFSLPAAGGTPYDIHVEVQMQAANPPGSFVNLQMAGTLSNVP